MAEETYHELDLEYNPAPIALDGYTSSVASTLESEYGSYMDSGVSLGDSYYSDEYFGEQGPGSADNSETRSNPSNRAVPSNGSIYGGTLDEQLEKEIDYLPIKDWQAELQALLKMPDSYEKYRGIARLGLDFQHAASLYSRVIVSECKLPENQKTIHTADVGGVAGGM
jgi:hypothetical protein